MTKTDAPPQRATTVRSRRARPQAPSRPRIGRRAKRFIALVVVLAAWEVLARIGVIDPFYGPPPSAVVGVLVDLFATGEIWPHLQATFTAAIGGLVIGVLVGAVFGFAAALIPTVSDIMEPVMIGLNAVPRVILAPLFIMWFGIGIASKIALAFLLVSVLMFFSVFSGIKEADQRLVERVTSFGGGTRTLIREVYGPSVTAWVMSNLKVAVGLAFTGAVVGEFVVSTQGLGYLLAFAQSQYNAPLVLALIALVMTFVLVLFNATGRLERRLLHWRYAS